jgi:hypothetical protein
MTIKIGQVEITTRGQSIVIEAPIGDSRFMITIDKSAGESSFTQVALAWWGKSDAK